MPSTRTMPRLPIWRVTPPVTSCTLGDLRFSPMVLLTPGISTPMTGRVVPPLALNHVHSVRRASSVGISELVGAVESVLMAGPRYAYW